ncbi:MAG: hypothetical protein U0694_10200 [Anaerolineae bacterium]
MNVPTAPSMALTADEVDELARIMMTWRCVTPARLRRGASRESPEKLRRILVSYFRAVAGRGDFVPPRCNAPHFSTVIEVDVVRCVHVKPCPRMDSCAKTAR